MNIGRKISRVRELRGMRRNWRQAPGKSNAPGTPHKIEQEKVEILRKHNEND